MKLFNSFLFLILFFSIIKVQASDIEIPPELISAIIKIESNNNPNAISPQGCIGLMQINPKGALKEFNEQHKCSGDKNWRCEFKWIESGSLFNAKINVHIGTWYLNRLANHYLKDKYTIERLLCAWNGGITRLRKLNYDCSRMPRESREFSRKVLRLYEKSLRDL